MALKPEKPPKEPASAGLTSAPGLETGLDSAALAEQKIAARLRLLELPPEEAQAIVEQTLYPQLWQCRAEDHHWEESLPSQYGETDA